MSTSDQFSDDEGSVASFRFLPAQLGESEDLERYAHGGFHPVHIYDEFDNGRYRVFHKLGHGGFSTVWLARDLSTQTWVALKIVVADESAEAETRALFSHNLTSKWRDDGRFVTYQRFFHIDGPNGRHLCLVLLVLGPSAYQVSHYLSSRMRPVIARHVALRTTQYLADLHSQGLCHGDLTPNNVVFRVQNLDSHDEREIRLLFGEPESEPIETESGEIPGPEAPQYIIQALDFLSVKRDLLLDEICIIDFDQAFLADSPPEKLLGTPPEFLAPEVAVGRKPSPASDVWALACSILRMRSGRGIFDGYEVDCPSNLLSSVTEVLGDFPQSWGTPLFDRDGRPTTDPSKGSPFYHLDQDEQTRSLKAFIADFWDDPGSDGTSGMVIEGKEYLGRRRKRPYPSCFSGKFWKPGAVCRSGVWLGGYNDDSDPVIESLPKIDKEEVDLLYDLISKILRYEPGERPTAKDISSHPWFLIP